MDYHHIKNKRGQVTIFIIIAVVLIGVALLFYFLLPKFQTRIVFDEDNPQDFIQMCLEEKIEDTVKTISLQGGSMEPTHHFTYDDKPIEYLCFTNENYKTCVIQQPLLRQHVEIEVENEIQGDVDICFSSLKDHYERRGFDVKMDPGRTSVEILPNRITTRFNYVLTVTKSITDRHDSFSITLNNNLYESIEIANSILEWEAIYGNADPRSYMLFYPDISVEKNLRDDGTKIYIISERDTENKFQFASRSLVTLPGY
ncbi:hypothetical protein K0A97_01470 [Patescibacteria group bacterium]|nr:hypothetical protein [Patescibacteria group bacterium]